MNLIERQDYLKKNLQTYGEIGLRTLVLAQRAISEPDYKTWSVKYQQASKQLEGREEKLWVLQDELEKELELIGATAIEDKL
jgi:phospholipid-transporting ATPase